MENSNKNINYPDLKINGRIFPLWILKNFNEYTLPEIIMQEGDDPCNREVKQGLREYQIFTTKYFNYDSPYKDMLLYVGVGGGKTVTTIAVYNMLYDSNQNWNVFILIKAALRDDPWEQQLQQFLTQNDKDKRYANIHFINYDSPYADKAFREAINKSDVSNKNFYIIDEAHNFIRNVYSNITENKGKARAYNIYKHIQQDKLMNRDTRTILLTATPAINKPYELALLFNLLRPKLFNMSEAVFERYFIDNQNNVPILSLETKNTFQRRIMGLVSYYIGATPDLYAKKTIKFVDVPMQKYQSNIYKFYETEENTKAAKIAIKGKKFKLQKTYTRYSANFVYPKINSEINGFTRPRASQYKVSKKDELELLESLTDKQKRKLLSTKHNAYLEAIDKFTQATKNYFEEINNKEKNKIKEDIKQFKKYDTLEEFLKLEKSYSNLLKELMNCSMKYVTAIFNILKSKGPALLYTNNVLAEGFDMIRVYLHFFGFSYYTDPDAKEFLKYGEFRNGISKEDREKVRLDNNSDDNVYGKNIKILMFSPAGAEGINLKHMRQVHIIEPWYSETRITQMIGRGVRYKSHCKLPIEERTVDIFRYRSLRHNIDIVEEEKDGVTYKKEVKVTDMDSLQTEDHRVENNARSKENLLESFLDAIKEVAIDCELYKNHNMYESKYKCFKFNETSYFDQHIGPAYKDDINDDIKINNGSNSKNSITQKVRVIKIYGVIHNSKDTKKDPYWFNPNTNMVYDFDLHYPVGKIKKDQDGKKMYFDNDIFYIDNIPIPNL